MAVEIPVVIDIDKAFEEAANRVGSAIRPLKQTIDDKGVLELKFRTTIPKDDLRKFSKEIQATAKETDEGMISIERSFEQLWESGKPKLDDVRASLVSFKQSLNSKWNSPSFDPNSDEVKSLQKAIILSEEYLNNRNRAVSLTEEQYYAELRAAREAEKRNFIIQQEATTISQITARLSALRGNLDNLNPKTKEWRDTALEINRTTAELEKYQNKLALLGTKSGSIDRMSVQMQQLTKTWNAMSREQKFDKDGNIKASAQKVIDKYKQLTIEAEKYGKSLQEYARGANVELEQTNSRLATLIKNSIRLAAIHASTRFIRDIREVTAEFELQRVALGGIIQDTEEANALFRQIKAAAIQSPFEIKDLVSYTKQLSAYRVETENLFDVTMRLADVSAGLGVDMSRLILAYGQVRAASVLRGQELRQFTEAGIPLVELLAQKFSDLNGRMVSTAEVFDLISKRAVPFEMISEIFEDMTDKGGMFYKMQEKQAETLAGQWANLKDALSIMYDEMGNTDAVHNAMTALISDAKNLMQNWRTVATVLKTVGSQYVLMRVASLFLPTLTYNTKLAEKATQALARAQQLETAQQAKSSAVRGIAIKQLNAYSREMMKAATAQTLFGRGLRQITASFLGGGWVGLAITAMSVLVGWFISARQEANRLNKELEKIGTEGSLQINRSVSNFQRLANAAVEAADGSNEQNEALEELKRTYGDIIPSQNLQIDKLRELKGNYESLTEAIEQKINMQIREQKVNATTDAYAKDIQKNRKSTKNLLLQYGLDKEQINAVMDEVQNAVDTGLIEVNTTAAEKASIFAKIIKDLTGIVVDFGNGFRDYQGNWRVVNDSNDKALKSLNALSDTYLELHSDVDDINKEMENSVGTMGVYAKSWDDLTKAINGVSVSEEKFGKSTTFSFKKEKIREEVELMVQAIEDAFEGTNIDISKAFDPKGTINFEFLNEAAAGSNRWGLQSFIKHVQESYEAVVPTNRMISVVERKFKEIADQVGLSMDDVQGYLLRGEKDMKDYTKEIASDLEEAKYKVVDYQKQTEDFAKNPYVALPVSDKDVSNANKMVEFLTLLSEWLKEYAKQTKTGAHQTDPWITNMQDRIKFMQDFKKGYDDLKKYISSSSALAEEAGIMLGRGTSLGLSAEDQQRAAENLSGWYEDMIKATSARLRGKGLAGATVTDLLGIDTTKRSKDIQELQKLLQSLWDAKTDFDISQKKKDFEDALKRLSDEIKRSEVAKNFFKNMLDLTGDEELAANMTMQVYGDTGDLAQKMQEKLAKAFVLDDKMVEVDDSLKKKIAEAISGGDYKTLRQYLRYVVEDNKSAAEEVLDYWEKTDTDFLQGLYKTYQKTKSYEERVTDVRKKESQKRKEIEGSDILSPDQRASFVSASQRREEEEIAKIRLEELKDTYTWTKAFEDLDGVSTRTINNLIDLIDEYIEKYAKGLDPQQLKELTRQREQARVVQLQRNSFKGLVEVFRDYNNASKIKTVFDKAFIRSGETYNSILDDQAKAIDEIEKELEIWESAISGIISSTKELMNVFSSDEDASFFGGLLDDFSKTITGAKNAGVGFLRVLINPGDITSWTQMLTGLSDVVVGIFSGISATKIRNINKQIERQQDLLDDLSYSYDRLEKAMAKAFGSDYIYNYNKQLENLNAQIEAYNAQADLERGKGKKADADKIKEYENNARDAQDQIAEMNSQLSEFFAGTDLTSAAKDFATSWIEAYKEFGSTTDAMKERFQDLIESMVTQSLGAKIMQSILQPLFDEIDAMAASGGELTTGEIAKIANEAPMYIGQINDAMTNLMNQLGAAGYNLRQGVGGFTGISRDIAGASEESITGLAAGINTQNFYMSLISQNVAAILAAMTGETVEGATGAAVPDPYKEQVLTYMGSLPQMRDDMYAIRTLLERVIKPIGTNATHYVATRM